MKKRFEEIVQQITRGKARRKWHGYSLASYRYGKLIIMTEDRAEKTVRVKGFEINDSREKATKEFIYKLEGTTLFNTKIMKMFDKINALKASELEEDGLRIVLRIEAEEDDMIMLWFEIVINVVEENAVEETELEEEIIEESDDEDEDVPNVLYSSDEDETDEDETDEDNNGIIYDWSLEVAGKEDSATYHPTLRSLIDYAMSNEECLRKGAYVTRFDGETYVFVQELTNTINKMLKSVEVDERLPF